MKNRSQTYTYNGVTMRNECVIKDGFCNIKLTQGKWCKIDIEDMELVGKYRWYAGKDTNTFYVRTNIRISEQKISSLLIHTLILGNTGLLVCDHINHNGLDNTRKNIRKITTQKNCMNRNSLNGSSSKYLGVFWNKTEKRWIASVKKNKINDRIGGYKDEHVAGLARAKAFIEEYGEEVNPDQTKLSKETI